MKPIANSKLWLGKKGHLRQSAELIIYRPEINPKVTGEYRCRVLAPGTDKFIYIFGEDSAQALMLGIAYVIHHVDSRINDGWKYYFTKNDRKPIDPKAIWMLKAKEVEHAPPAGRGEAPRP
jgi:hypothetical protein